MSNKLSMKKWLLCILSFVAIVISVLSEYDYWPFKTNDLKVKINAIPFKLPDGFSQMKFFYLEGETKESREYLISLRKLYPNQKLLFLPISEQRKILNAFVSGIKEARNIIVVKIKNNGNKPLLNIIMKLNAVVYYEMTDSKTIKRVYASFSDVINANAGDSSKVNIGIDALLNGEVVLKSLPQGYVMEFLIWTKNEYDFHLGQLISEFSVVHSEGLSDIKFYTPMPARILLFYNSNWLVALVLFIFAVILIPYFYIHKLKRKLNLKKN